MSTVVDKRIVEMDFDNADFESNVKTSLSTLDRLKMSLGGLPASVDFGGVANVSDTIQNSLTNSFQNVAYNVQGIFSRIGNTILTDTVLQWKRGIENIIEEASVRQLAAGWNKYAEKTKSVQTIMAATKQAGESEEEAMARVNEQLEKLMWFSDETSYSFNDMVSNIGKFTSQGIELDKATNAMMGISNWAAVSGAGVNEASRAMYNLSQALALGSVRLMDWKSIENANMATKEFKEMVIESGLALGTLEKKIVNGKEEIYAVGETGKKTAITFQNMSQTLTEGLSKDGVAGWFNNEVLMDVLGKYSEFAEAVYEIKDDYDTAAEAMAAMDKSGFSELAIKAFQAAQEAKTFEEAVSAVYDAASSQWSAIFEEIFGDYLNAKVVWTDLANWMWDVFAEPLDVLNGVLDLWNNINEVDPTIIGGTGSFYIVEGLTNILNTALELITLFRESYRDAIGSAAEVALGLYNASQSFYNLTLKVSGFVERHSEQIASSLKILTSPIRIVMKVVKAFFEELKIFSRSQTVRYLGDDILFFTASIGEYVDNLVSAIEESDIFNNVFKTLFKIIGGGIQVVKNILGWINNSSLFKTLISGLEQVGEVIGNIFESFFEFTSGASDGFSTAMNDTTTIIERLGDAASGPLMWLFDILKKIFEIIGNFFTSRWEDIRNALTNIPGFIENVITKIGELWNKLKGFFEVITQGFDEFLHGSKEDADPLANAVDSLGHASESMSKTDLSFMKIFSDDIGDIMEGLGKIGAIGTVSTAGIVALIFIFKIISKVLDIIKTISTDANAFGFIDKLKKLPDMIFDFLNGWKDLVNTAVSPLKILAFMKGFSFILSALGVTALEIAGALFIMALIPSEKFKSVTTFFFEVIGTLSLVYLGIIKFIEKSEKTGLDWLKIKGVFTGIGLFALAIGGTLLLIAFAAAIFNKCENGVVAMLDILGILAEIALSVVGVKHLKLSTEDMGAIFILSFSLYVLGIAIIELAAAALIFDQIKGGGFIALVWTLGAVTIALGALAFAIKKLDFDMADAASMVIASVAIGILAGAVIGLAVAGLIFNSVSEEGITRLLLTIAGLTVAVGALGMVASKLNPASIGPILALSVLMGSMAISMVAFAGACMLFSKVEWEDIGKAGIVLLGVVAAIAIFVGLAAALTSAGPAAIGVILGFVSLMLSLAFVIGSIGVSIWLVVKGIEGFIAAFQTLSQMNISTEEINNFISNFGEILKSFGDAFIDAGWHIMEKILEGLNNFLARNATSIFTLAVTIIDILAEGIIKVGPKILEALNNLIKIFMLLLPSLTMLFMSLRAMATAFFGQLILMLGDWISMSLQMLEDRAEEWGNKAALIVSKFYIGFVEGMTQMSEDIIKVTFEFILGFIQDMIDALDEYGPLLHDKGWELFDKLMETMFEADEASSRILSAVGTAAQHIIEGLVNGLSGDALSPLANAAYGLADTLINKFKERTDEHSPSKVFEKLGGYIPEGVAIGIKDKTDQAVGAMKDSADSLLSPMKDSISSLFTDLNGEDMNPVISPILDLSNVDEGMGDLSSYFNSDNFNLSGSYSAKASSASSSGFSSGSSSDLNNMFASLMDKLNTNSSQFKGMADTPVNVNVMLEGDTKKIFQVVQRENSKFKLSTGHGGF